MKRLLPFLLAFILCLSTLVGCADFKDINRRLFIVAIGIDMGESEKNLEITLKAAIPKENSGATDDQAPSELYTVTGDSLANIFREVKSKTSLEPDFSHMKLIMFGKNFSKYNSIYPILDFFIRRRDFQNVAYIAVGSPTAKEILKVNPKEEKFAGNSLFMKFGEGSESQYAITTKLFEMYGNSITPGISPFCSIIELEEDKYIMERIAVFDKGVLKVELNKDETVIFNLLKRKVKLGSLVLNNDNTSIGLGIHHNKVKIKPSKSDDENSISFDVKVNIKGGLEEIGNLQGKMVNYKTMLSEEFSKLLTRKVSRLLHKFQENKIDPLEFSAFYWAYKRSFNLSDKWLEEMFPHAQFNLDCTVKVERVGNLK